MQLSQIGSCGTESDRVLGISMYSTSANIHSPMISLLHAHRNAANEDNVFQSGRRQGDHSSDFLHLFKNF